MSSFVEGLLKQLGPGVTTQIGQQLGVDSSMAEKAITSALPVIVGGLARNTQESEGASALDRALEKDHDGSLLEDLGGYLTQSSAGKGDGILGHIFGGQRSKVEEQLGSSSGLDSAKTAQLMAMLAPLVMGALGKQKRSQGLDAGGVSDYLRRESEDHGGGMMGMVTRMLDQDGDGSVADDLLQMGGKLLSNWTK